MNNPIIEMQSDYPFGSSGSDNQNEQLLLVHKELPFINPQQKQTIEQIVHFLQALNHQYLVNLTSITQEPTSFHLYYEYIPFKLQSWVLGVNEELAQLLQIQLIKLTKFLARSNIVFQFDPSSVGLTSSMNAKYFLKQFSVDLEHQNKNSEKNQLQIKKYFSTLKKDITPQHLIPISNASLIKQKNEQKKSESSYIQTVSTTSSVSNLNELKNIPQTQYKSSCTSNSSESSEEKSTKMTKLYEKIKNSKQKSQEVLNKLKSIKIKLS